MLSMIRSGSLTLALERLVPVLGEDHVVALAAEPDGQRLEHGDIVVGDENGLTGHGGLQGIGNPRASSVSLRGITNNSDADGAVSPSANTGAAADRIRRRSSKASVGPEGRTERVRQHRSGGGSHPPPLVESECRPGGPYGARYANTGAASDRIRRRSSKASVGPEGRTERSD